MALQDYINHSLRALHTGSRVICNPPVMDTDDDYLLLIEAGHQWRIIEALLQEGFIRGGSLETTESHPLMMSPDYEYRDMGEVFQSYKKTTHDIFGFAPPYTLNIILTADESYFDNFYYATVAAKRLNLLNKADRVALFNGVCFDDWPEYRVLMK